MTSRQDEIWNRACLEDGGSEAREGDRALASLLQAHGLIMNGGVLHAIEALSQEERAAAIAGYRYFGLLAAAQILSQHHEGTDAAEHAANSTYALAVRDDDVLVHAFRVLLLAHPEAFSPVRAAQA